MSVRSMIRRQGTRATIHRPTTTTALDGSRYQGAPWTAVSQNTPVNVQEPTAERTATVFGTGFPVDAVAYADPDATREGDRIACTAGPFSGEQFEVVKRVRHRQGSANDHDELALVSTSEVLA